MNYNERKMRDSANLLVREGLGADDIYHAVIRMDSFSQLEGKTKEYIKEDLLKYLQSHANFGDVQRIMNCKILMLEDNKNKLVSYSPFDHSSREHSYDALTKIMNPKVLNAKLMPAITEYSPRSSEKIFKDRTGRTVYNKYQPPAWKFEHFYNNSPIDSAPLPKLYYIYFTSLLDNDIDSYNYLINWLALSLREKNKTMLGAIGKQRIGKGVLAQIIAELHGKDEGNGLSDVSGGNFGSQFNAIIEGKTFVEFSEVKLTTQEEINSWKQLINERIQIEKKGIDARVYPNYANILLTANNMSNIKLGAGDQRVSLLNLADTMLSERLHLFEGFATVDDLIAALKAPENIAALAAYLWHYPVDRALAVKIFQSKTLTNLRKSQLWDWEKEFIASYCRKNAGRTLELVTVIKELDEDLNQRLKLRAKNFESLLTKLEPLLKELPGTSIFKLFRQRTEEGARPLVVEIAKEKFQPEENFLDNFELIDEN